MLFTLRGAHLIDATLDIAEGDVLVDDTHIRFVGQHRHGIEDKHGLIIDATDTIIAPGFIEVHTHGGGGLALHTTDPEEIRSYARWVASTGVTSFLIAIVGTPASLPETQLQTAVEVIENYRAAPISAVGAEPLGIFLEGPYINVKRRGAHPPARLRTPSEAETTRILELAKGYLQLVTLAPELSGAEQMIRRLIDAGVTVSLGHSDADYEQARAAIQQGVTHVTHCFNAMRPLLHREPGPIGAIAQAEHVFGELIVDGIHVHPAVMDILVRILGPERIVAITDAHSCAGLTEDEAFEFAGQSARVIDGAVRLADGTLTGSVLTMTKALQNLLTYTHVTLSQAIGMLTANPARSIKVADRKGLLESGYDADLLIFDRAFQLQATICRGKVVFANEAWKKRIDADYAKVP
jgi:N-acetylglucosamine-6-phosphate deacetylase